MILVLNRLRQLNGNNWIVFIFLIALVSGLSSCGAGKTDTPPPEIVTPEGVKVFNPKTGKYEYKTEVVGKVDTIEWRDGSNSGNEPIESDPSQYLEEEETTTGTNTTVFDTYNVAIMIPFNTHKTNTLEGGIHGSSMSAISYYEGVKMALEKLDKEGLNLKIDVFDSKRSDSEVRALLTKSELQDAHMIIGPYSSKPLKEVAAFAKERNKILISPVNTSSSIISKSPNYIQVNPSLQTHCHSITEHAMENYEESQIVLVCRNKDVEVKRLAYFQEAKKRITGDKDVTPFREFKIDATIADEYGEIDLLPYIREDETTVFIVPSYSNEGFVSNLLRQMMSSKGQGEIVVYGMPRWQEYTKVSYDYYERLNVHISNSNFVNRDNHDVKAFYARYFEKYGGLPDDNVFKGYDATLYFGRQLKRHGTKMAEKIDSEFSQQLSTKFEFQKNGDKEAAANEDFSKINFIENKYVNILMFKDFHFQKAK